ncbi:MAG: hypothetical protein BJ554DRAFT_4724 [Olpidium bornovanus]|uniref:Uncharacterized protein n=1 Tax=Olpidium bornovanus TaxID=278681 RepID=A0A8H7ZMC5_9FUNG|nr:MAG: hypothetical protein BJ554DRAFT_4724 [Olpidium bornovanus]
MSPAVWPLKLVLFVSKSTRGIYQGRGGRMRASPPSRCRSSPKVDDLACHKPPLSRSIRARLTAYSKTLLRSDQNGANSGVGQAVIQLAKTWGLRTVNIIRSICGRLLRRPAHISSLWERRTLSRKMIC